MAYRSTIRAMQAIQRVVQRVEWADEDNFLCRLTGFSARGPDHGCVEVCATFSSSDFTHVDQPSMIRKVECPPGCNKVVPYGWTQRAGGNPLHPPISAREFSASSAMRCEGTTCMGCASFENRKTTCSTVRVPNGPTNEASGSDATIRWPMTPEAAYDQHIGDAGRGFESTCGRCPFFQNPDEITPYQSDGTPGDCVPDESFNEGGQFVR